VANTVDVQFLSYKYFAERGWPLFFIEWLAVMDTGLI
jgi:hypothetical protein